METGRPFTTEEITTKIDTKEHIHPYKKLSIQVGLNGLSFCILDTIGHKVLLSDKVDFKTASTPYLMLKALKSLVNTHKLTAHRFSEVNVVHKNHLYCLVPKTLFDKKELANYLKFNTKILACDHIVYDVLPHQELVCVYVPFTNINNYIFDCFGAFEFKHNSAVLLQSMLHQKNNKLTCYVHVGKRTMELLVFEKKTLQLYNQFDYKTKEDFLYYILFTYEQLGLPAEEVKLKLFGSIEEDDRLFAICYQYIKKVVVFIPKNPPYAQEELEGSSIDLTLLSSI
ncbi:MAG: DUF3822 family protein [Bacteroidota bacterium]